MITHHILVADGELQFQAFMNEVAHAPPGGKCTVIWLANSPLLNVPAGLDVIHIPRIGRCSLLREVNVRQRFAETIRDLVASDCTIRFYANGAQHFFGNYAAFSRIGTSVLIMDGMNTIVHRPMNLKDIRNSLGKFIIGILAGLMYRPYMGNDVTGSRFFREKGAGIDWLRRALPPYDADPDCVVVFDQGLFELMGEGTERRLRFAAEAQVLSAYSKVIYRSHPRVGDTRGESWVLAGSVDASGMRKDEMFLVYRPATIFSFFSTALFEYPGLHRVSVLPETIPHYNRSYVNRLAAAFKRDQIEVFRV